MHAIVHCFFLVYFSLEIEEGQYSHQPSVLVVMTSFLLLATIVRATYSSNLVATSAVQRPGVPFETFEELAADREYTMTFREYSITHLLLQVSQFNLYFLALSNEDGKYNCIIIPSKSNLALLTWY